MDLFLIVSDNNTNELKVMKKDSRNAKNVYVYEPIASCATFEEAENLKQHIESIGIQSFFNEIVQSIEMI